MSPVSRTVAHSMPVKLPTRTNVLQKSWSMVRGSSLDGSWSVLLLPVAFN